MDSNLTPTSVNVFGGSNDFVYLLNIFALLNLSSYLFL